MAQRVQVVVRVRPCLPTEDVDDVAVSCSPEEDKVQVLLPDKSNSNKQQLPGTKQSGARSFSFDACLPGKTTQADLFETCGMQELVDAALDGYSVTIFAFGQTGSGKTHTMIGPRLSRSVEAASQSASNTDSNGTPPTPLYSEEEDGLVPRCLGAAFQGIVARAESMDFKVTTSCIELYNEVATDLLGRDRNKQCQVRQEQNGVFKVDGLTETPCSSAAAALRAISYALQWRHTRAHAMNEYSSRSHCLMTFNFQSKEKPQEGEVQGAKGGVRRYGKLVLVDLAGSERLKETGNTGSMALRETGSINRSLFTLGQVLAAQSARSTGNGSTAHVPYRDSKLTALLWEGLRGTGRALMLACLGPMKQHAEECLSTLHFASMATRIKAEPVVLLDPQDQLVMDLRNTIRQLREDNKQLALAMAQLSSGADTGAIFNGLPDSLRLAAGQDTPQTPQTPLTPQQQQHARASVSAGQPLSRSSSDSSSIQNVQAGGSSEDCQSIPSSSAHANSISPVSSDGLSVPTKRAAAAVSPPIPARNGFKPTSTAPARQSPQQTKQQPAPQLSTLQHSPQQQQSWQLSPHASEAASSRLGRLGKKSANTNGWLQGDAAAGKQQAHNQQGSGSLSLTGTSMHARPHSNPSPQQPTNNSNIYKHAALTHRSLKSGGQSSSPQKSPSQLTGQPAKPNTATASPTKHQHLKHKYAAGRPVKSLPQSPRKAFANSGPPKPKVQAFPELDAMELEFQQMLSAPPPQQLAGHQQDVLTMSMDGSECWSPTHARQQKGGANAHRTSPSKASNLQQQSPQQQQSSLEQQQPPKQPPPEPKALSWAERNPWFGSDLEMTALAYEVHDQLVGEQGADPSSNAYYEALENRVQQAYPARWAASREQSRSSSQGVPHAQHSSSHGLHSSPNAARQQKWPSTRGQSSFGGRSSSARRFNSSGLRVQLKDPTPKAPPMPAAPPSTIQTPAGTRLGAFQPVYHLSNSNQLQVENAPQPPLPTVLEAPDHKQLRDQQRNQPQQSHYKQQQQHHYQPQQQQQPQTPQTPPNCWENPQQVEASDPSNVWAAPSHSSRQGSFKVDHQQQPDSPDATSHTVSNGFKQQSFSRRAPPSPAKKSRGASRGGVSRPKPKLQHALTSPQKILNSDMSLEDMQKEYIKQRAAVLEELQRAKNQAEEDRRMLLGKFSRQFGGSRWGR